MGRVNERLDRAAVDRVLRRANDLAPQTPELADGVEPDALIEAAAEAGIDPNAVRDSLAIERLGTQTPERRRRDRVVGPEVVVVERELHRSADAAVSDIDAWLTSLYRLVSERRSATSVRAVRRSDVTARVGRSVAASRGRGRLDASLVEVDAVPRLVGSTPAEPRCVVRVTAARSTARAVRLGVGGAMGAGGAGLGSAVVALSEAAVLGPIVGVPLLVGGGVVAFSGRSHADRLELEIERMLSRVDRNERPERFVDRVLGRARSATRPR